MSFDKPTRNRLSSFVGKARDLIADEFTQQFQSLYGISDNGAITPLDQLAHLDDPGLAIAALLRERIDYLVRTHPDDREGNKAAVARLARELAFTVLNRLAAIRMAEKRGLIVESVGKGYQSKGFKVFEQVAGAGLGDTYHRYCRYLFCLFDELAVDLGVLFDRRSPQGLLFPRETALQALFGLINAVDLEALWAEDETIGWVYQYYNDPAERKKMREESAAPRNSRELAVRNQFFTPRYVVEFLTDNTLGRIWYEMTQGKTRLAEQCRYLVRRRAENFLNPGETAPVVPGQEGLSQEELLKQPIYIPHRPLKDPRELRMLDPACGSMHFGLYAFDLYEIIYEEAWEVGMESLHHDFPDKDTFLREVPRLIIEHNIHGIDIDPRAAQIAGLSLWLRAQKSWQGQCVPAAQRPRILRSNVVCAEPMPGNPELLKEFSAALQPPVLGQLLEKIFAKMQIVDEAGSLLKIEEEIAIMVKEAKKLWQTRPKVEQMELSLGLEAKSKQGELPLDVSGISDERFWETAEEHIYTALHAYAEQAESGGYQRRLFAEDAARGFAFIDLCRKRYNVVVMNPPFGEWSALYKIQAKKDYPSSYNDILAAFVDRGGQMLISRGHLGAITSRTCFFLSSFAKWREEVILGLLEPRLLADLGLGVMDSAMVEAAAYVLEKTDVSANLTDSVLTCFRLLNLSEPADLLLNEVEVIKTRQSSSRLFAVMPSSFRMVPNSPFAYWVSERIRKLFIDLPQFEGDGRTAKIGASTKNDFRFLRLNWELPMQTGQIKRWYPFAKGGAHSPFYADIHLQVNWLNKAEEIEAELLRKFPYLGSSAEFVLHRSHPHLRRGLTWPIKNRFTFKPWPLPEGCVFAHVGPSAFFSGSPAPYWGLMSASVFTSLLRLTAGWNIEVGVVQRTVVPNLPEVAGQMLGALAKQGWALQRGKDTANQTSHAFLKPALTHFTGTLTERGAQWSLSLTSHADQLASIQFQIDEIAYELYGIDEKDRQAMELILGTEPVEENDNDDSDEGCGSMVDAKDIAALTCDLVDYSLGSALGRWDIRLTTAEKSAAELPDPFTPLPVCPPGMLQNSEGLPAELKDVPADYPLRISWTGILVDDENHPEDIITRVEDSFKVIWKDRWEVIEHEACELLGVKTLRDYFRRPSGFFADHLKRYSKSRRQAPIYWPLSTAKGSYTLWIYYHRLTDQTLHTALADFVDPKLKSVRAEISALRDSVTHNSRLEELLDLEKELEDFHTEIERIIKLPWKPNLNDGVLITASPLWKLFRLPKWQKDLKACWEKLEKKEYDWAHLAYSIWPKRVEELCRKDRSIAIAHGLEHLCEIAPPKAKAKRGKKSEQIELEEMGD